MSTSDFFHSRLDTMIDLRHALAVLATPMPWASIDATLAPMFIKVRYGAAKLHSSPIRLLGMACAVSSRRDTRSN
jgi:hypothetical protein